MLTPIADPLISTDAPGIPEPFRESDTFPVTCLWAKHIETPSMTTVIKRNDFFILNFILEELTNLGSGEAEYELKIFKENKEVVICIYLLRLKTDHLRKER